MASVICKDIVSISWNTLVHSIINEKLPVTIENIEHIFDNICTDAKNEVLEEYTLVKDKSVTDNNKVYKLALRDETTSSIPTEEENQVLI